jgi:hypothetical protein
MTGLQLCLSSWRANELRWGLNFGGQSAFRNLHTAQSSSEDLLEGLDVLTSHQTKFSLMKEERVQGDTSEMVLWHSLAWCSNACRACPLSTSDAAG